LTEKEYSYAEYKEMLDWEFPRKLHYAEALLRENLGEEPHVVSFSGGKSSLVALHLTLQVCSDTPVLFNNTGVALPGIPQFVRSLSERWDFELIEARPERDFWDIVEERGYPKMRNGGNGKPMCCYHLKEKPLAKAIEEHGWKVNVTGMQATESMQRRLWFLRRGGAYFTEKYLPYPVKRVNPLAVWRDEEVWTYIRDRGLPYWEGYDKYGITRTGCLPCTAFVGWERKMRKVSPALYQKVKREKDNQEVLDNCL